MNLHRLFIFSLFLELTAYGAAGPSSSVMSMVEDEGEMQLIVFQWDSVNNFRSWGESVREHFLDLNQPEPITGKPYRVLRQRAIDQGLPWMVCAYAYADFSDVISGGDPRFKWFDQQALLEESFRKRAADLASSKRTKAAIRAAIKRREGRFKCMYYQTLIFDRHNNLLNINSITHRALQLRYVLQADLGALKEMISLWHHNSISGRSDKCGPLAEEYISSWCKRYLAEKPNDVEVVLAYTAAQLRLAAYKESK